MSAFWQNLETQETEGNRKPIFWKGLNFACSITIFFKSSWEDKTTAKVVASFQRVGSRFKLYLLTPTSLRLLWICGSSPKRATWKSPKLVSTMDSQKDSTDDLKVCCVLKSILSPRRADTKTFTSSMAASWSPDWTCPRGAWGNQSISLKGFWWFLVSHKWVKRRGMQLQS